MLFFSCKEQKLLCNRPSEEHSLVERGAGETHQAVFVCVSSSPPSNPTPSACQFAYAEGDRRVFPCLMLLFRRVHFCSHVASFTSRLSLIPENHIRGHWNTRLGGDTSLPQRFIHFCLSPLLFSPLDLSVTCHGLITHLLLYSSSALPPLLLLHLCADLRFLHTFRFVTVTDRSFLSKFLRDFWSCDSNLVTTERVDFACCSHRETAQFSGMYCYTFFWLLLSIYIL